MIRLLSLLEIGEFTWPFIRSLFCSWVHLTLHTTKQTSSISCSCTYSWFCSKQGWENQWWRNSNSRGSVPSSFEVRPAAADSACPPNLHPSPCHSNIYSHFKTWASIPKLTKILNWIDILKQEIKVACKQNETLVLEWSAEGLVLVVLQLGLVAHLQFLPWPLVVRNHHLGNLHSLPAVGNTTFTAAYYYS